MQIEILPIGTVADDLRFVVKDHRGNSIAAFAMESDANYFIEDRSVFGKWADHSAEIDRTEGERQR